MTIHELKPSPDENEDFPALVERIREARKAVPPPRSRKKEKKAPKKRLPDLSKLSTLEALKLLKRLKEQDGT